MVERPSPPQPDQYSTEFKDWLNELIESGNDGMTVRRHTMTESGVKLAWTVWQAALAHKPRPAPQPTDVIETKTVAMIDASREVIDWLEIEGCYPKSMEQDLCMLRNATIRLIVERKRQRQAKKT